MRTVVLSALVSFGLALLPATLRADLAPPIPAPKEVNFKIEVDEKAKAPKLIVPINLTNVRIRPKVNPLPAPINPIPGKVNPQPAQPAKPIFENSEEAAAELSEGDELVIETETPKSNNRLIIVGLCLTLALGFGGMWLVRRNGKSVRGLALLMAAGGTIAFTSAVWANAPPPPQPKPIALPTLYDGKVTLELVPNGDTIRLVVDAETAAKLKKDAKAPDAKK